MGQIHISVLGTKIVSDAIEYKKRDFALDARIVEKSPFAYTANDVQESLFQKIKVSEITLENSYKNQIFNLDLSKSIFSYVKQFNSDIIVVDVLCMRNLFYELEFSNGNIYRLTWDSQIQKYMYHIKKKLEQIFSAEVIKETRINPLLWSEKKLEGEIIRYCDKLKKEFAGKKIVLLEAQNIYQYFDKFERFAVLPHIDLINQYNAFYDICEKYFKQHCNCIVVSKTEALYGDEKIKSAHMFHYNLKYYEYINQCLESIYKNEYSIKKAKDILNRHNLKNKMELKERLLKSIVDLTCLRCGDRKIIVLGETEVFSYLLKKKYGIEVYKSIYFNKSTSIDSVKEQLSPFAWKSTQYIIVVTSFCNEHHILKTLWEMGYGRDTGYICMNHPLIKLENFKGHYEDFYGNYLDIKTPITVQLSGCGIRVVIGKGEIAPRSFLTLMNETTVIIEDGIMSGEKRFYFSCYDGSVAHFGRNTYLGNNFHLRNSFFYEMYMGNECVLEDNSVLFNGDGHAIFDLNTKQNINYNLTNTKPQKHKIILGNCVHIGKHAFVLCGSQIPSGCMVEAESFVNKIFYQKNCYLAGVPAMRVEG